MRESPTTVSEPSEPAPVVPAPPPLPNWLSKLFRPHPAWRFVISALVIGACVWFFMRLDLHATWRTLLEADYALLVIAAIANLLLHQGLKALRWYLMLGPHTNLSFWRIYLYTLAGNAASHALPARAGEALRAGLVQRHGVPLTTSAGVQLLEAAVEVGSLILVTLPVPWILELPPGIRAAIRALYIGGGVIAAIGIFLIFFGHHGGRFLAWLLRGGQALRSPRVIAVLAATTIAARYVDAGILILCLRAVGLDGGLWTAFLVILAVDAVLILPTTPGGFGGFEAACVGALHLVGKPAEPALAFGIAYHAIQQIPGMLAGAAVMLWARPSTPSPEPAPTDVPRA